MVRMGSPDPCCGACAHAALGFGREPLFPAMPSLSKRIMRFVQSPQGQQLIERAKTEAAKPENRRKLEQLRARYLNKRR
jgi:hypothetical protein